jgi:DNA-directed RNA polymerase specialized sigma24 family protein
MEMPTMLDVNACNGIVPLKCNVRIWNRQLGSQRPGVADHTRCVAAIAGLSDAEHQTLKNYAASRVRASRGVRYYANRDDLVHEAITRTLDGRRTWKPHKVDIVTHLKGCVRSIANQYDKESRRRSDTLPDEGSSDDEKRVCRTAMLCTARLLLKPDAIALDIFNLLVEGHTARAIRTVLNIDLKTYYAARKRVSRRLRAGLAA